MGNTASDRKNARCYSLKFSKNTDAELIEWLDSHESIQGYLKSLIRADMRGETEMSITEFVRNIWENDSMGAYKEKMDLETAKSDLENFAADEMELPEGITPESYMEAWNKLVDSVD